MSDMGMFRIRIEIAGLTPTERRVVDDALVDTGSEYTWVPRQILDSLGIKPAITLAFRLADGRQLERPLGMAVVHAAGRFAPDWVVFAEPGDTTILGAHSLEGLNVRADPRAKQLVDAGPVITAAA